MKALVKYERGVHNVELREVPVPEIGDDDVLMEVKAAGLCGSDLSFYEGKNQGALNTPVILGHEFAGVVAEIGKNVTDWKKGDRVMSDNTGHVCGKCYACATADFLSCPERLGMGYGMDGGFAKYVKVLGSTLKVYPKSLLPIPDDMTFEEAAVMDPACNGFRAAVQNAQVKPGDFVAVFGVGALGQFAIQAARVAGAARIFAIARSGSKERMKIASINGATHILYADQVDLVSEIKRLTDGKGLASAIDCAGANELIEQAIDMVRLGGIIVKVGYDPDPPSFSFNKMIDRAITLKGHFAYDWRCWESVTNLSQAKKLSLDSVITHKMGLSEYEKALGMLKSKEALKIILYPED